MTQHTTPLLIFIAISVVEYFLFEKKIRTLSSTGWWVWFIVGAIIKGDVSHLLASYLFS